MRTRPVILAATAVLAVLACIPSFVPAAPAAEDDMHTTVDITQDGWWNRLRGPVENEPSNPLRPALPPQPDPLVPGTALAVSALAGQPDRVAGVGFLLDAPPGATVERLKLTMKADAQNARTAYGAGNPTIRACPIINFWAGAKNANWVDRPQWDCQLATAEGTRNPDFSWTFDLTPMAQLWLDEDGDLEQMGIVLESSAAAPVTFLVSFGDLTTGAIVFDFLARGGGTVDDVGDVGDVGFSGDVTDVSGGGDVTTPSDFGLPSGSFSSGVPRPTTTPAAGGGEDDAPVRLAQPARGTRDAGGSVGDISPITAVLVPLVLGVGLLLCLILGPAGEPATVRRRRGGVSRALAARESRGE